MTPYIFAGIKENNQNLFLKSTKILDLNELLNCVCEVTQITKEMILRKSRERHIVEPRMMFIGIALSHVIAPTLKTIGSITNQHHSTVLHSRETFADLYKMDKRFKYLTDKIKSKFYEPARN